MTVNTLGSDSRHVGDSLASKNPRESRTVAEWLWPLLTGGLALFAISALIYYRLHRVDIETTTYLQMTIAGIYNVFGLAPSVVFFLMVFAWSCIWAVTGILERPVVRLTRLVIMALMLGVFFNLGNGGVAADAHTGALGAWVAGRLVVGIGYFASVVLVWPTMFASVMLATDWFFTEWFERDRKSTNFEVGVEGAVTDHLRGLAQVMPKAEASGLAPTVPTHPRRADHEVPASHDAGMDLLAIAEQLQRSAKHEPTVLIESMAPASEAVVSPRYGRDAEAGRDAEGSGVEGSGAEGSGAVLVPERPMSYSERRRQRAERRVVEAAEAAEQAAEELAAISAFEAVDDVSEVAATSRSDAGAVMVTEAELAAMFGDAATEAAAESDGSTFAAGIDEVVADVVAEDADDSEASTMDDDTAEDDTADDEKESAALEEGIEDVEESAALEGDDFEDEDEDEDEDELEGEGELEHVEEESAELEDEDLEEEDDELEDDDEDEDEGVEEESAELEDEELDDEELEDDDLDDDDLEDDEFEDDEEAVADHDAEVLAEREGPFDEDADDDEAAADESVMAGLADDVAGEDDVVDEEQELSSGHPEAEQPESDLQFGETLVSIPRPEAAPAVAFPTPPAIRVERAALSSRQQKLFGTHLDEGLLAEATEFVASGRRTTATLLQRKLRIDYELAVEVLAELTTRGLVSGDEDRS